MSENQKKIWITGASSGIGKAVAEKFPNEGWKVAVSARRKELLDELAKHSNINSFPLDVTNQSQINNVFKDVLNAFGDIDICLFSSGTYDPKKEQEINIEQNKFVMNVNYFGTLNCVKSVEEYFKKEKILSLFAISSNNSFLLADTATFQPSRANFSATALPMPLLAPVTQIFF